MIPLVGREALADISALCTRSLTDPPTLEEIDGALFSAEEPAKVRGDPRAAVVATVGCEDGAHIRLIVVDPSARGRGRGHELLEAAESDAIGAGLGSLTVGADPSFFLWPGVPASETAMLCLLERRHYARVGTNFDMSVELSSIPADPKGHELASLSDRAEIDSWMASHWPNWRREVLRALDKGNLVVSREEGGEGGIVAFCAFEVNRSGFLGPVAVRPDLMGKGRGRAALIGALHELRRRGSRSVDVVWVGPVAPYAAVGGAVSNMYFVYRREFG